MLGFSRILVFAILRFSPSLLRSLSRMCALSPPKTHAHTFFSRARSFFLSRARTRSLALSRAHSLARFYFLTHLRPHPRSLLFFALPLFRKLSRALANALSFSLTKRKCRGPYVRFGMGMCHSLQDVDRLVLALETIATSSQRSDVEF